MADVHTPTTADMDNLLAFLPIIESDGFSPGDWTGKKVNGRIVSAPSFQQSDEMDRFVKTAYDGGWVVPFNWPSWEKQATKYLKEPDALKEAGLNTVRMLLTTHIRKDRFVEGHLAEVVNSGHIASILRRVKALREEAA